MRQFAIFGVVVVALAWFAPIDHASAQTPAVTKLVTATNAKVNKAVAAAVAKQAKAVAKSLVKLGKLVLKDASEETIHAKAEIALQQVSKLVDTTEGALDKALMAAEAKLNKLVTKNPDLADEVNMALGQLESSLSDGLQSLQAGLGTAEAGLAAYINYVDPTPDDAE